MTKLIVIGSLQTEEVRSCLRRLKANQGKVPFVVVGDIQNSAPEPMQVEFLLKKIVEPIEEPGRKNKSKRKRWHRKKFPY